MECRGCGAQFQVGVVHSGVGELVLLILPTVCLPQNFSTRLECNNVNRRVLFNAELITFVLFFHPKV
jgi:hypothetical protein